MRALRKLNTTVATTDRSDGSLGDLQDFFIEKDGIAGYTSRGDFRLTVFSQNTIRVSISRASYDDFSYAVIASPAKNKFTIDDTPGALIIKTTSIKLVVQKFPVRFSFYTVEDVLLNEDDAAFGTSWNGEQVTTYKKLQPNERFLGLGEKTGSLDRRGKGYQNWNTDYFGYGVDADPIYATIPFYIGVHSNTAYGIFFDNPYKSFFNFGASNNRFASFYADAGEMNYYFIHDDAVGNIIQHYTALTGRMELPPKWSLGFQQCRYSYYPDTEVITAANTFRDKDIPADAIVLDIHYMDEYKIFTWSEKDFSNPSALLKKLNTLGFKVVLICDPGIKIEKGYHTYESGKKENVFLKYPDNTNYEGQVWPGWCHFPDFTKPETRAWWKKQLKSYVNLGIDGFWNDMNEIATWGQMIPENIELDFDGNKTTMRKGRNVYGFQMARATYEGSKALSKKRPFNLTRSGYSGIQRYGALWTGDNVATDEHLLLGVRLVNSLGLSGVPFAGYDVGGFVGDADQKLFARWISIGALSPFFRGHSMINTRDSEPWAYGEDVEHIARNYIKLRYQLLPYLYSVFFEASKTGMPVQRSLAIDYTHDPKIYEQRFENQYLFGPSILVAPVDSKQEFAKVYLPEGAWYELHTGKKHEGKNEVIVEAPVHKLPIFIKESGIIPVQKATQNTTEKIDIIEYHVYAGSKEKTFVHYTDDGESFDHEKGNFASREIKFSPKQNQVVLAEQVGDYMDTIKKIKIVFHHFSPLQKLTINGEKHKVKEEQHSFFTPITKFDPVIDPPPHFYDTVQTITITNKPAAIQVKW